MTCINCGRAGHEVDDCPDPLSAKVAQTIVANAESRGLVRTRARLVSDALTHFPLSKFPVLRAAVLSELAAQSAAGTHHQHAVQMQQQAQPTANAQQMTLPGWVPGNAFLNVHAAAAVTSTPATATGMNNRFRWVAQGRQALQSIYRHSHIEEGVERWTGIHSLNITRPKPGLERPQMEALFRTVRAADNNQWLVPLMETGCGTLADLSAMAQLVLDAGVGNCTEIAIVAAYFLVRQNVKPVSIATYFCTGSNANHHVVALAGTGIEQIVCDGWTGIVCPRGDYEREFYSRMQDWEWAGWTLQGQRPLAYHASLKLRDAPGVNASFR